MMSKQLKGPKLNQQRPRVIMSAYACGAGDEPEAGAGWGFARAAAVNHDVWVVTRRRFKPSISAALADDDDLVKHLTVHYLDLPPWLVARARHSWDVYWYYVLWQRQLARLARDLHKVVRFDLAHHVTFANDWLPCGINKLQSVPLVWGPVGGASRTPSWRLARWLGLRGSLSELIRLIVTGTARKAFGDPVAKRARVVVVQNCDVQSRFRRSRRVVVEPNAAFDDPPIADAIVSNTREYKVAVFVGRLLALKGCRLAVATMAVSALSNWRLEIYGTGPERQALMRMAQRLGVSDRIEFKGHRPREEVLSAFLTADAMLFPSMHDQAGWAAAEASAAGCPVVCLPLGGPATMAGPNAHVVEVGKNLVSNLAAALQRAGASRGEPYRRWSVERLPALVDEWYADAMGRCATTDSQ